METTTAEHFSHGFHPKLELSKLPPGTAWKQLRNQRSQPRRLGSGRYRGLRGDWHKPGRIHPTPARTRTMQKETNQIMPAQITNTSLPQNDGKEDPTVDPLQFGTRNTRFTTRMVAADSGRKRNWKAENSTTVGRGRRSSRNGNWGFTIWWNGRGTRTSRWWGPGMGKKHL